MLIEGCMNKDRLEYKAIIVLRTLTKLKIFYKPLQMPLFNVCGLNPWSISKERGKFCLSGKHGKVPFPILMKFSLKRNTWNPEDNLNINCWHHI